jgi:hypothetical protein
MERIFSFMSELAPGTLVSFPSGPSTLTSGFIRRPRILLNSLIRTGNGRRPVPPFTALRRPLRPS